MAHDDKNLNPLQRVRILFDSFFLALVGHATKQASLKIQADYVWGQSQQRQERPSTQPPATPRGGQPATMHCTTARLPTAAELQRAGRFMVRKQVENNSIGGFIEDLCSGSACLLLPECLRETKEKHDLKGHRARTQTAALRVGGS